MITINNLSKEAYNSILSVMPQVVHTVTSYNDLQTFSITLTPMTDIDTNNILKYVTLKYGNKFVYIYYRDFSLITIG